jgi:midasin
MLSSRNDSTLHYYPNCKSEDRSSSQLRPNIPRHGADEVQLAQLDRFQSEIQVLSHQLTLDSERITQDQHDALPETYRSVLRDVSNSHCTGIISQIDTNTLQLYPDANISDQYRRALSLLQECYRCTDLAKSQPWIMLGLVGLALYVPNYPHDPALLPMVERKLFNEEKAGLIAKLQELRQYQIDFTGQQTSFRIRQTESAIQQMGEEPPIPAIIRPVMSELDALQGEFSNLLSVIQPLVSGSMTAQEASVDTTLRQNIAHIIRRLQEGYRSYDDITAPAIGFLVCLSIGLTLGAKERREQSSVSRSLAYLAHQSPFYGLRSQTGVSSSETLLQACEDQLAQKNHSIDLRWHALHSLAITKIVDPGYLSGERTRQLIYDLFSSLYGDWKTKLMQDQKEEAKNTNLYTFRGDDEEEEEEDPSLFPDYEQETDTQPAPLSTSREHAIRLANMHLDIFVGGGNAPDAVKKLLEWCAIETARVAGGEAHGTSHENALPALYLSLEKRIEALASSGMGKSYNFYFDANLPEAKRLITHIHSIQHRYRQIRKVWPEHATLWEVLRTCDEVLEFRHVDPIAKLITKAEKLHGYMYEWQRVASREFSTANLFDDLTKLLVSWRQLELTTWARLFDIEMEKCRDDAKSWFFIAYETLVAAAESIENERDMKVHAQQLLKSLEGFFYATTMGQYEQRIALLQQLHRHIIMRVEDVNNFKHVASALENFIAYFSRIQKPVHDALVKGRQTLEKEVNNVIKLASWKDTNIEVLRQSAKTSHRKLSKMVRKFRKLLNQPVSGIVKAGFPDEGLVAVEPRMEQVYTSVSPTALELCTTSIPAWGERPTRFKNLAVTISMMRRLSTPNTEATNGAAYIESFIADLEGSITELQKATPTTLTEDNKETVQHLKTQKRKLYADTMKELRRMGVKMNLSSDVLARQDELSTVLASLPIVVQDGKAEFGKSANFFLHKALSIMSQVREVAKEHSGDLTGNDVSRSIGFLEGLLSTTIRQRGALSKAAQALGDLQEPTIKIATLCGLNEEVVTSVPDAKAAVTTSLQSSLSWLCAMLSTGADIVAAQAKLGKISEVDDLVRDMRDWSGKFCGLVNAYEKAPTLPVNVWSETHQELDESIKKELTEFHATFKLWLERYAISRTVLKHIEPYILTYPDSENMHTPVRFSITIDTQSREIFAALDMVLGSMQDVESALKDLPTSTDDATWLVKEEQSLYNAANALHGPQIGEAFATILDKLHSLHEHNHLQAIVAMFASVQPILSQYIASYKYLVERYDALHCSTAKLLHRLSKSFIQIGTQGFCQPSEKSSDQQQGKDDKLEPGTGLGEGEGAEDISKDIEDDEDLEELAQEKNGEREGSIEEQEDAVDMGEQDMEGETGEVAEKEDKGSDGEEGDDDVQSEVGSVDDLGPSAVDEKMWDEGGKEEDLKDKEGKEDIGTENQDEQVAAEPKEKNGEDGEQDEKEEKEGGQEDEEMEMEGEDQEENVGVGETEQMDPHAKEEETLDLPDELDIDGDGDEKDDDLGDMDMDDDLGEEETEADATAEPDTVDEEIGPEQENEEEKDTTGHVEDEDLEQPDEDGDEPMDDDAVPLPDQNAPEDEPRDAKDDHRDPNAEAGAGADSNEEAHQNQKEQASASAANREDGNEGESAENMEETTAEDGTLGQTAQPDAGGRGEQPEDSPETQSFKKLGDVLEKWYNQQKQISEAREQEQSQVQQMDKEVDMAKADFEHLGDEEEKADTQALGTATEEQARALNHDMAMPVDEEEKMPVRPEDQDEAAQDGQQDVDMEDAELGQEQEQQQQSTTDSRPQAFVGEQKPFSNEEDADMQDAMPLDEEDDSLTETSSLNEVDTQLELTHLTPSLAPTADSARTLWLSHESSTHSLSQQLTESLRLILAPTLATKLRGDFRTGKRLNLKRIIPYIASGYKRDKIWLRRSMPSKRNYQVLIALDDSRSMRESGSMDMGLKTLTLVTRSLSMLEVGEVGVVGFGEHVNVAHEFDKPFTSEAGVRVFEQFGFEASKTNVRGLVDKSLELFGDARRKGSSSAGEDLWQLMLIVSDGICDSHADIQRLVRKAQEERVMIVFVIIDSSTTSAPAPQAQPPAEPSTSTPAFGEKPKEKTSIMDLQSVEISKEGKVVRWKYMERFPFRYYLVVRDVRELPGVLAGALRQWFGEVAGSA